VPQEVNGQSSKFIVCLQREPRSEGKAEAMTWGQGRWSSAKSACQPPSIDSSSSNVSLRIAQLHLYTIDRTRAGIAGQEGDV